MAAQHTDVVPVVLITLDGEDFDEPLRLSSDPTERLSSDPLAYGTVSSDLEYQYVLMGAMLPDDQEGAPPAAQIVIDNVTSGMIDVVRAAVSPIDVTFAVVFAHAPDDVEEEYTGMQVVSISFDEQKITLSCARTHVVNEGWPHQRMSKDRFPGLFAS